MMRYSIVVAIIAMLLGACAGPSPFSRAALGRQLPPLGQGAAAGPPGTVSKTYSDHLLYVTSRPRAAEGVHVTFLNGTNDSTRNTRVVAFKQGAPLAANRYVVRKETYADMDGDGRPDPQPYDYVDGRDDGVFVPGMQPVTFFVLAPGATQVSLNGGAVSVYTPIAKYTCKAVRRGRTRSTPLRGCFRQVL